MKKVFVLFLAVLMVLSMFACTAKPAETVPVGEEPAAAEDPAL